MCPCRAYRNLSHRSWSMSVSGLATPLTHCVRLPPGLVEQRRLPNLGAVPDLLSLNILYLINRILSTQKAYKLLRFIISLKLQVCAWTTSVDQRAEPHFCACPRTASSGPLKLILLIVLSIVSRNVFADSLILA